MLTPLYGVVTYRHGRLVWVRNQRGMSSQSHVRMEMQGLTRTTSLYDPLNISRLLLVMAPRPSAQYTPEVRTDSANGENRPTPRSA